MSNVYRRQIRIGEDELDIAKSPSAFVTALLVEQVKLIVAEHQNTPDPQVRGADWRITYWHDLKTHTVVFSVYCGAEFDLDRWTNPGKRVNRLVAMRHNHIQERVSELLKRGK